MKWIKRIIGFIKLYKDYEYEPETWRHIVETYQQILCNRTKTMSKPTYYIQDILAEMDKWYEYHDEYECGREYVSNYGKCPICTDCPDNCPLDNKSLVTDKRLKYRVGDRLLIKSKIMPKKPYDIYDESEIRVCTSCSNGWDRFRKEDCNIEDGYVIHEVIVKSFDTWTDGSIVYHCTNDLSVTRCGWQGVRNIDVVKKIT